MKKKITSMVNAALMPAFILAVLLFSSCTKNELDDLQFANLSKTTSTADVANDKTNNTNDYTPNPSIPADAMIGISHGSCMGMCPNYRVTLSRNGDVTYTGINNVRVIGTVHYTINPDVAYQLGYMMEQGGFFTFADEYIIIPDAQRFETSLVWNGKIKTVVDYGINVPQSLILMREKVERALDIERLINGKPDNPAINATY